ncbi:MAG: histidine--tRNA ligase [Candidatus Babeliales bacterium]
MIQKVKGTQDFLDMTLFNYIVSTVRTHAQYYHFHEIATPIIEPLDLFVRSLGEQTDVVSKEMFLLEAAEDKDRICLRPEGTAPIVRAFIENGVSTTPWKVFSCGPMFRYERPQKGRYRQFNQITLEVIGSNAVAQDAQFLTMLDRLFSETFMLDSYALIINFLGCHGDRDRFKQTLYTFLNTVQDKLCANCTLRKEKNILRVFDCKNPVCQELYTQAPVLLDHLCSTCNTEWQELQRNLNLLSVAYSIKPSLVRGLDYYGKTVFEFVSGNLGAQNAFCGGGRYDSLAKELGAKEDQPSLGAAFGIERLMLLLEPIIDRLPLPQLPALNVIIPLDAPQQGLALLLADELYAAKICTEVLFDGSLKSRLRKADKLGAAYVILIGEQEQQDRMVTVKNMQKSTEERVAQDALVSYLKK